MDRRDIEELTRDADRQAAADRARDATLRRSGERLAIPKADQTQRREDPGPVEGASGR